jgi:hypothetical protein
MTTGSKLRPSEFAAMVVNASMLALREKVKKGARVDLKASLKKPKNKHNS